VGGRGRPRQNHPMPHDSTRMILPKGFREGTRGLLLCEHGFDDVPMHIGEAVVAALEGEG
jgi:hypothetical protein